MKALLAKKQTRVILIAAAAILVLILVRIRIEHAHAEMIKDGVAYLETMQAADVSAVESEIRAIEEARIMAQRDEIRTQLEAGEIDVWSFFKDDAVMGDSRAVGFYYFEFMPKDRVFADGGNTIRDIEKSVDYLVALQPADVFLCYGLNDVSIGYWSDPASYVSEYAEIVHGLQEKMPDTTFYINSTLPARDPAFEKSEKWRKIPEFNEALKEMCEKEDIPFIDNSEIAEQHTDLWDIDGIHVKKEFYKYWATDMIMATFDQLDGNGADETETLGAEERQDEEETTGEEDNMGEDREVPA